VVKIWQLIGGPLAAEGSLAWYNGTMVNPALPLASTGDLRAYILCVVIAVCKSSYAPETARRRGVASIVLSVIGIVFGITTVVIVVILKVIELQQHVSHSLA